MFPVPLALLLLLVAVYPVSSSSAVVEPNTSPATQPLPFSHPQSLPATIPAFPEQSAAVAGCPLDLPADTHIIRAVKTACGGAVPKRIRCCPVLAAWLYASYSAAALAKEPAPAPAYDMPLLPDDSETCVGDMEAAVKSRGVELARPNQTCDLAYCYCGIRLHRRMSCSAAFSPPSAGGGKVVAAFASGESVGRLERDCHRDCTRCLKSLNQLNGEKTVSGSQSETDESRRVSKMRSRECELMGVTWLLSRNRTAYFDAASNVLRAIMMAPEASDTPQSCTLDSDGMPLAVDSSELPAQNAAIASSTLHASHCLAISLLLPMCFMYMLHGISPFVVV